MKNHYQALNIDKNATLREIRKAYHKIALKYHPDKSNKDLSLDQQQQAKAKFIAGQEAYEVLSDPNKREQYDKTINVSPKPKLNAALSPSEAQAVYNAQIERVKRNNIKIDSSKKIQQQLKSHQLSSTKMTFDELPQFAKESASRLYENPIDPRPGDTPTPEPIGLIKSPTQADITPEDGALARYSPQDNCYFDEFYKIDCKTSENLVYMHSSKTGGSRIICDNWTKESVMQSIKTIQARGISEVRFLPESEPGAFQGEMRLNALNAYETMGIKVINADQVREEYEAQQNAQKGSLLESKLEKPEQLETNELSQAVQPTPAPAP